MKANIRRLHPQYINTPKPDLHLVGPDNKYMTHRMVLLIRATPQTHENLPHLFETTEIDFGGLGCERSFGFLQASLYYLPGGPLELEAFLNFLELLHFLGFGFPFLKECFICNTWASGFDEKLANQVDGQEVRATTLLAQMPAVSLFPVTWNRCFAEFVGQLPDFLANSRAMLLNMPEFVYADLMSIGIFSHKLRMMDLLDLLSERFNGATWCTLIKMSKSWLFGRLPRYSASPSIQRARFKELPTSTRRNEQTDCQWLINPADLADGQTLSMWVEGHLFDWKITASLVENKRLQLTYDLANPNLVFREYVNLSNPRSCWTRFPATSFCWSITQGTDNLMKNRPPIFICLCSETSLHWSTLVDSVNMEDPLKLYVLVNDNPVISEILYQISEGSGQDDWLNRLPHVEFRCLSASRLAGTGEVLQLM